MDEQIDEAPHAAHPQKRPRGRTFRVSPKVIAAVLVVTLAFNGVVLAWRWAAVRDMPAGSYYAHQIRQWETQSIQRPDDPVVWATLGGLYENSGDERKAETAYTRALEIDGNNVAALLYLAGVDERSGDVDSARQRLRKAADALPEGGSSLVHYRLGRLEEKAGDLDAALVAYSASVAQRSTYWNAHYRIALLHEKAGELKEALAAIEQAALFAEHEEEVRAAASRIRKAAEEAGISVQSGVNSE